MDSSRTLLVKDDILFLLLTWYTSESMIICMIKWLYHLQFGNKIKKRITYYQFKTKIVTLYLTCLLFLWYSIFELLYLFTLFFLFIFIFINYLFLIAYQKSRTQGLKIPKAVPKTKDTKIFN